MNSMSIVAFAGACALTAAAASAGGSVPIPGLFNTGVNGAGNLLPAFSADPHYTVLEVTAPAVVINDTSSYLPNNPGSGWVWQNGSGQPTNVIRTFRISFDLTGLDPNTAVINGQWGTDNFGDDILINGVSTGQTSAGFGALTPFTINGNFLPGINTLDFIVRDVGVISAFRVDQISGSAFVPAPGAGAALALGGLAAARRRRR